MTVVRIRATLPNGYVDFEVGTDRAWELIGRLAPVVPNTAVWTVEPVEEKTPMPTTPETSTEQLLSKLWQDTRVPPSNVVATLKVPGRPQLDYVGHADTVELLLAHDPLWTYDLIRDERGVPIVEKRGDNLECYGTLTVHGFTRPCVGTCKASANEAMKELVGDMIRNGAMRFGVATTLWSKADHEEAAKPTTAPAKATGTTKKAPAKAAGATKKAAAPPKGDAGDELAPPEVWKPVQASIKALDAETKVKVLDWIAEQEMPDRASQWTIRQADAIRDHLRDLDEPF